MVVFRIGAFSWLVLFTCAFVIGCSGSTGPTGTVKGKVTYKGNPPPQGTTVQFLSNAGAASAQTGADGNYTAEKVKAGAYQVTVSPPAQASQDPAAAMKAYEEAKKQGKSTVSATKVLPEKYLRPDTSKLKLEVKEGNNDFNIDLTD